MKIHHVGGGGLDCNQFLLLTEQAGLLVDAGTGMATQATLQAIREAAEGQAIEQIYLTHWHHDHVGGAPALARELEAELLMPEAEAQAVREGRAELTLGANFGAEQEAHPVIGVQPGDTITVGQQRLEVLHTPGHTAGHTSLWHPPSASLLAGDVVFSHGSFGRVDLPTGDADELLTSLERLTELGVENLYPGHMHVVEGDAGKHIELALSQARGML